MAMNILDRSRPARPEQQIVLHGRYYIVFLENVDLNQ
jgi:hypothetical protein